MDKTLIVIPARGGSKGVPRKNLRQLGDKPLIAHAIVTALELGDDTRVIVSTEDNEIAAVAREYGAETPFTRPAALAGDAVSLVSVVQHAAREMATLGWDAKVVVSLQATTPFTSSAALREGIAAVRDQGWDAAVSVAAITGTHPFRAYALDQDGAIAPLTPFTTERYLQRQDRPPAFGFSSGFYARRRALLEAWNGEGFALGARCRGVLVPAHRAVDINSWLDFTYAEAILAHWQQWES